jgi:hypothetical protein
MRGYVLRQIERVINRPGEDLQPLIDDLAVQNDPMVEILTRDYNGERALQPGNVVPDRWHRRHLRVDWFGRHQGKQPRNWKGRWWRGSTRTEGLQPVDPVIRLGLWTTLQLRLERGRPPVHFAWICAGHHLEVVVLPTNAQITALILTPHEGIAIEDPGSNEASGDLTANVDNDVYVVRRKIADVGMAGYVETTVNGYAPPPYQDDPVRVYQPRVVADPD